MSGSVMWFRREIPGLVIDVKLEKAPGQSWHWQTFVRAAAMLMSVGYELLNGEALEETQHKSVDTGKGNGE